MRGSLLLATTVVFEVASHAAMVSMSCVPMRVPTIITCAIPAAEAAVPAKAAEEAASRAMAADQAAAAKAERLEQVLTINHELDRQLDWLSAR